MSASSSMTVPSVNIAVAGLGWVALHRHIPALRRHGGFNLIGVVDRDAAKAAAIAARLGVPHHAGSRDLREIPWLEQVQAVTIGAPPMNHHHLVCAALMQGKHVLTEKPFAMSMAEGESMLEAARARQKILAVVHNFQFARAMMALRRDLAAGKLGTLRWIAARQLGNPCRRLPAWYQGLPLGLFYDESPHFYYLLRGLAGDLALQDAAARGRTEGDNTPREIRLLYQGGNGLPVSIDCNFDSPLSEWFIMAGGTEGLGIVDIFRDFYIWLPQDGAHTLPHILRSSVWATAQHWAQYIPNGIAFLRGRLDYGNDTVMDRFHAAVTTGAPPAGIATEDALAVLRLQQEAASGTRWL